MAVAGVPTSLGSVLLDWVASSLALGPHSAGTAGPSGSIEVFSHVGVLEPVYFHNLFLWTLLLLDQ